METAGWGGGREKRKQGGETTLCVFLPNPLAKGQRMSHTVRLAPASESTAQNKKKKKKRTREREEEVVVGRWGERRKKNPQLFRLF